MDILPSPASIFTPPTPSAVHTPFKTPCTMTACPSPVWDVQNCVEGGIYIFWMFHNLLWRFLLRGYIYGYLHTTHRCARESIGHPTEPHCLAYVLFLFSQKVICVWWSKSLPKISSKSHFVNGTDGMKMRGNYRRWGQFAVTIFQVYGESRGPRGCTKLEKTLNAAQHASLAVFADTRSI